MAFTQLAPVWSRRRQPVKTCRGRRAVVFMGENTVSGSQLIWCEELTKSYDGVKTQLQDASFVLTKGAKVGVIGVNGTGKSTLIRLLAGAEFPDSGKVTSRKGLRVVVVEQDPISELDMSPMECVFAAETPTNKAIRDYERTMQRLDQKQCSQQELQTVMNRMDAIGAWDAEANARQILSRLGLQSQEILSRKVKDLSGGQQKRVALAAALVQRPDVLMLDEPTNHLDIDAIEWLEMAIREPDLTTLLVTHDRYFLDRSCNEILELDRGKLYTHLGGYKKFLEAKAARLQEEDRLAEVAAGRLKKEAEWMRRQPKARATKSKARIEQFYSLQTQSKKRKETSSVELAAKVSRIGNKILQFEDVSLSFGEQVILDNFTYEFKRGDRIGIVGGNGVGKTTFLKVLMQMQTPDSGEIVIGDTVVFGYYDQAGTDLPEKVRVVDYIQQILSLNGGSDVHPVQTLQKYGFDQEQMYTEISRLSGGEKRRLQLLEVMTKDPNFLVLDEVTNDLDLQTLTLLENFLLDYKGVLVVVSHDRFFMDRITNHLFVFEGQGRIKDFVGNFSEYLDHRREQRLEASSSNSQKPKNAESPQNTVNPARGGGKKKMSNKERTEYERLPKDIENLEARQNELEGLIGCGESDYSKLSAWTDELATATVAIEEKTTRWLELEELYG